MGAAQTNRLESDVGADCASVIIQARHDWEELLCDFLYEEPRMDES